MELKAMDVGQKKANTMSLSNYELDIDQWGDLLPLLFTEADVAPSFSGDWADLNIASDTHSGGEESVGFGTLPQLRDPVRSMLPDLLPMTTQIILVGTPVVV